MISVCQWMVLVVQAPCAHLQQKRAHVHREELANYVLKGAGEGRNMFFAWPSQVV